MMFKFILKNSQEIDDNMFNITKCSYIINLSPATQIIESRYGHVAQSDIIIKTSVT